MLLAIGAGIAGLGLFYWAGVIDRFLLTVLGVLLFPVYLIFVALVLSLWLGYDKGPTDVRRVDSEEVETTDWERKLR